MLEHCQQDCDLDTPWDKPTCILYLLRKLLENCYTMQTVDRLKFQPTNLKRKGLQYVSTVFSQCSAKVVYSNKYAQTSSVEHELFSSDNFINKCKQIIVVDGNNVEQMKCWSFQYRVSHFISRPRDPFPNLSKPKLRLRYDA